MTSMGPGAAGTTERVTAYQLCPLPQAYKMMRTYRHC